MSETGLVRYFATADRSRTTFMVVLLVLAGVLEGAGFAAFLPLLEQIISPEGAAPNELTAAFYTLLGWVGLPSSFEAVLGVLVVAFLLKALVITYAMIQVGFILARVGMELRLRLLRGLVRSEWKSIANYPSGFVANAVSRETERTAQTYREFCRMIAEAIQVVAYLVLAMLISWQITLVALLGGVMIMGMLRRYVGMSRDAGREETQSLRGLSARLADALPSLKPLKAMAREGYLIRLFETETQRAFRAAKDTTVAAELLNRAREPIVVMIMAGGLWSLLLLSPLAGTAIIVMALLFYRAVTTLTNVQVRWATVRVGESAFISLMEHIDHLESREEVWVSRGGRTPPLFKHEMRLEGLRFSYDDQEVLHGVSVTLKSGSMVLLKGESGSGKTTLTDLLMGLLQPSGGRILIDGEDLQTLSIEKWRRRIGYVPQEPMLFSDTTRQNIALGATEITDQQVHRALAAAGAAEFVNRFETGLDQPIGEAGRTLSGGQKQRLAIARALVCRPRLLILDEPTTALDAAAELEICRTVESLKGSLTILAISHQPALERVADEIWTLDRGVLTTSRAMALQS